MIIVLIPSLPQCNVKEAVISKTSALSVSLISARISPPFSVLALNVGVFNCSLGLRKVATLRVRPRKLPGSHNFGLFDKILVGTQRRSSLISSIWSCRVLKSTAGEIGRTLYQAQRVYSDDIVYVLYLAQNHPQNPITLPAA